MAFGEAFVRVILRLPMTPIPDHDCPAAIFALRDRSFEFVVGNRVVLDLHCKSFFAGHQTGSPRYGPAFHHAVELKAQIIMESACGMFLDDEGVAAIARNCALRLGGDTEAAFGLINFKSGFLSGGHNQTVSPFGIAR